MQVSVHDPCNLNGGGVWELFVVLDIPPSNDDGIKSVKGGDPDKDLVIGIATFETNSSSNNGESCGIVFIRSIGGWIDDIVSYEVIPPDNVSHSIISPRMYKG